MEEKSKVAYVKTLSEHWTLRDQSPLGPGSVLPPLALEGPVDVRAALEEQGLIALRPQGLDALKDEWIYTRNWVYECTFEWDAQQERGQVECQYVAGLTQVRINGRLALRRDRSKSASGAGTQLSVDLSPWLEEGENRLEISVANSGAAARVWGLGIYRPVRLRAGNYLTLKQWELPPFSGEEIVSSISLYVHTGGKYLFSYALEQGEALRVQQTFEAQLRPGFHALTHRIPAAGAALYDPQAAEDTACFVRLSVEKRALGCLAAVGHTARLAESAAGERICQLSGPAGVELIQNQRALARQLGADAVIEARTEKGAGFQPLEGFLPLPHPCPKWAGEEKESGFYALAQLEDMQALAGDQPFWPPQAQGVWALTASRYPAGEVLCALFGPNAMGDAGRAARLSRFWQAESVRRAAMEARIRQQPFNAGPLREVWPCLASPALVEYSGAARPAYDALQEAWRPVAVYAALPENLSARPGETVKAPLWALSRGQKRQVARLEAQCLSLEGQVVAAMSLTVMLGEDVCAGELAIPLPKEETAYILRMELLGGESGQDRLARGDYTLCAAAGDAPLAPLMSLEGALLREKGGQLMNQGRQAALGVSSAGYRALLPGESAACADTYECLNGLL